MAVFDAIRSRGRALLLQPTFWIAYVLLRYVRYILNFLCVMNVCAGMPFAVSCTLSCVMREFILVGILYAHSVSLFCETVRVN